MKCLTIMSFKPCYKWNPFKTNLYCHFIDNQSFKLCSNWTTFNTLVGINELQMQDLCFKPCYKWNTFNTKTQSTNLRSRVAVLNLVIRGLPSIRVYINCLLNDIENGF